MMISPEYYYEEYLKGKNEKQILTVIRGLKNRIGHLKNVMENPNYGTAPIIHPSEDVQISCNRLYLQRAIKALDDIGCPYKYSKVELKSIELHNDLEHICKITFEIGGYFQGFTEYTIEMTDDSATMNSINRLSPERNETGKKIDKNELLYQLSELYIGEWRKDYNPERFGFTVLDGTQWQLKLEFNNGRKPCEFGGSNSYPYNFNKLLDIFEIDGDVEL